MSRFLQVVLALVGLVLTAVLQLASNRNAEVQNAQGLVQLYTQTVSAALERCNLSLLYPAQDTAQELNALRDRGILRGATDFNAHLEEIRSSMTSCAAVAPPMVATMAPEQSAQAGPAAPVQQMAEAAPIAPEFVSRSQNLALRGIERRIEQQQMRDSPAAATDAAQAPHYAILASYSVSDRSTYDDAAGAAAHFNRLAAATSDAGVQLRVYRTDASNHFAIVLVAENGAEGAARELVAQARRLGWSPDAFVQAENNWTLCPNPRTVEGLRACAGDAINRRSLSVLRQSRN
jgi:hypothetical protein